MHPIQSRADRAWLVYLLFTLALVFGMAVPLHNAGASGAEAALFAAWGGTLMLLCMRSWAIARYVPIAGTSFLRFVATVLSASVLVAGLWVAVTYGLALLVAGAGLPGLAPALSDRLMPTWLAAAAILLTMLLLIHALEANDKGEAAARRALESDVASRDAELRALRAQVDPHFLFNCLHSISSLTSRNAEGARQMCLELADFFRASLRAGAEQRITLANELQLLRGYLNIEQVRFGSRLVAHVDEAGEAAGVLVPPLLLQPLVENAVRHGIATLIEGGTVTVRVRPVADRVEIVVENPFDPEGRRPGTGVGLTNVRDRLAAAFRGAAVIRVDTIGDEMPTFTVTMSIPQERTAGERSGADGAPRATRPGGVQGPPPEIT